MPIEGGVAAKAVDIPAIIIGHLPDRASSYVAWPVWVQSSGATSSAYLHLAATRIKNHLSTRWAACMLLERTTGRSYWHEKAGERSGAGPECAHQPRPAFCEEGPHVGVLYCFVLPAAALVWLDSIA